MSILKKSVSGLAVKFAATDDETMTFTGYGSVFGNVDSYGDLIARGAFKASLKAHEQNGTTPLMLLNHNSFDLPIGVWEELSEDDHGLLMRGKFLDTVTGRDAYTAVKAGALDGLSIGFRVTDFQMGKSAAEPRRTIKGIDLVEVSVVTFPANGKARVADVKSEGLDPVDALIALGLELEEAKSLIERIEAPVIAKYRAAAAFKSAFTRV